MTTTCKRCNAPLEPTRQAVGLCGGCIVSAGYKVPAASATHVPCSVCRRVFMLTISKWRTCGRSACGAEMRRRYEGRKAARKKKWESRD